MSPILIISTEHPLYQQVIELRQRILRAPLGLNIHDDNLKEEEEQIIFISEEEGVLNGCVLLQHYDAETFKLRQMAVDTPFQGKGIGARLLNAADLYAVRAGKHRVILHARIAAAPFYAQSGYEVMGDEFLEIGIPHVEMGKTFI